MKMKRVLALMLSSAMICTAVPGQVFAAEETLEVVNEFSDESDEDDFVEVEDRKLEESNADEKVPDTDEEISEIDLQEDNQQDLDIESGNDEDEIFSDSVANENSRKIIASGEENKTITWILYDDGELVISGSGDIPDYLINDVSIGKTSAPWNVYKENIKVISVEEGIKRIGNSAFLGCNVIKAKVADSVEDIGNNVFERCFGLQEIQLPSKMISIGMHTFYRCRSLNKIKIPEGITTISGALFGDCRALTSIEIPEGVTSINELAFVECWNLTNVKLPESLLEIKNSVFSDCYKLKDINIPKSVLSIGESAFNYCESLEQIELPERITNIENLTFSDCKNLTNIKIPNNVIQLGIGAFNNCRNLAKIEIPESMKYIVLHAFAGCDNIKYCIFDGTKFQWDKVKKNDSGLENIKIYYKKEIHEHDYEENILKSATCIEMGERELICSICGDSKTEEIPATGHVWDSGNVIREATCEELGIKTYICTVCEATQTEDIPALGHVWNDGIITKEPTCIETGEKTYTCTVCGKIKREEIPAVGHIEIKDEAVDPTCEEPGLTEGSHCSVCGVVIKKQEEIPALGHKFTKKKVVSQATVFRAARQEYECTTCGFKEIRNVGNKLKATIKVSTSKIIMKPQQKVTSLKVTFTKGDSVTSWKTSNSKVVKVAGKSKGTCTLTAGKIGGTATLTIKLKSGLSKKVSVIVNVKTQKITGISSKITLVKGQYITIKPKLYPATSTDKITFKSNNNTVSVNSSGKIYARKKGTAVITVKSGNKTVKSQITVEDPKISKTAISLNIGKKYNLKVTGTKQKVTWSSSNKAVATVSSNGIVTAKKGGSAKITAKIGNKKYICNLKVKFIITDKQITYAALGWLTLDEDSLYYHKKKAKLRKICIDSNNEIWYYYDAYILPCWARARIVPDNNILVGSCYHSSIPSGKALELTSYVWDYKPNVKFVQTISLSKVAIKKAELKKAQDYTISGY
ncbi:leucine-rich repeat protein [Blautia fusiformis]|uniref:leucine-rich repeat protein n=1 Tax=Blautia fusiformis TaxID=2881264 RepID=UPI003D95C90E